MKIETSPDGAVTITELKDSLYFKSENGQEIFISEHFAGGFCVGVVSEKDLPTERYIINGGVLFNEAMQRMGEDFKKKHRIDHLEERIAALEAGRGGFRKYSEMSDTELR